MAFRVPQQQRHHTLQSPTTEAPPPQQSSYQQTPTKKVKKDVTDTEEWVVFSPSSIDAHTSRTLTSEAVSRASFGSLNTDDYDEEPDEMLEDVDEEDEDDEDEEEEDDNDIDLHGFRDLYHQGPVMLPAHDGLGTFPSTSPQQVFQHPMHASPPAAENSFANSRIQAWRMDQSRILLDEIERATRGRLALKLADRSVEEQVTLGGVQDIPKTEQAKGQEMTEDQETFWKRLTRKVIQDIMGLDDMVLQIIFGEAVPDLDDITPSNAPETSSTQNRTSRLDDRWEDRLLDRLAKELGVLVNHYTRHPAISAFSAYNRDNTTLDDAGTVTPQARQTSMNTPRSQSYASLRSSREQLSSTRNFETTVRDDIASHASNWGIEDHPRSGGSDPRSETEAVREHWEKELNVRMLFSYLKTRFSTTSTTPVATTSTPSYYTTAPLPSHTRRQSTATITHPLIRPRQSFSTSVSSALGMGFSLGGGLGGSSCASESTKSAPKNSKNRSVSNNSRHYWEVATSVGSGSAVVGAGGWGDV